MTETTSRTPEQVRKEIEAERERLAGAVEHLRTDIGEAKDTAGRLKAKLPLAVALAGGIGAAVKYLVRRGRGRREHARTGRRSRFGRR
jgi:hypothetical protein